MGLSVVTYALALKRSKNYTDETAIAFGGLKGAPCQVKSVEKKDGQNIVTLLWENNAGDTRESQIVIDDGTPIYDYTPGKLYNYGDIIIKDSTFYRCIVTNMDRSFDPSKWEEVGGSDGNYSIVADASDLPPTFSSTDRKLYFSIDDGFFYLWDGTQWADQQPQSISNTDISKLF